MQRTSPSSMVCERRKFRYSQSLFHYANSCHCQKIAVDFVDVQGTFSVPFFFFDDFVGSVGRESALRFVQMSVIDLLTGYLLMRTLTLRPSVVTCSNSEPMLKSNLLSLRPVTWMDQWSCPSTVMCRRIEAVLARALNGARTPVFRDWLHFFIDSRHWLSVLTQRFEQLIQILLVDHLEVAYEWG